MSKQFSYHFTVLEADLDSFGHVNNAVYLRYFEAARWQMVHGAGFGLEEMHAGGLGPVILEVNVKFKKELRLRENVRIDSQVVDYTRAVAVLGQKLYDGNGELCAEATFRFALFDLKRRRLVPPNEKWIRAIGLDPAEIKPLSKV